jgi:hypothetical protein
MSILTKLGKFFEKLYSLSDNKRLHKARQDFISHFVLGMLQSRNVHFCEVAAHMDTTAKNASNLRRIQLFFAKYKLDYRQIATLLILMLPEGKQWHLSIDRTNWQFGELDINYLVVSVSCRGVGIPLWFELLEDKKRGNSDEKDRISLLRQVIRLARDKKLFLYADREFIGETWVSFLLKNRVKFFIRLRKSTRLLWQGQNKRADEWLAETKYITMDNVLVQGSWLSVALQKQNATAKKEEDYLIVLTNTEAKGALNAYRDRWSIEVFFQSIKDRGFHIENTHLKDYARLRKLMAMCAIAFAIALRVGIIFNDYVKAIKVKNHGYKANSFFRHGLEKIREAIRLNDQFDKILELFWLNFKDNKHQFN